MAFLLYPLLLADLFRIETPFKDPVYYVLHAPTDFQTAVTMQKQILLSVRLLGFKFGDTKINVCSIVEFPADNPTLIYILFTILGQTYSFTQCSYPKSDMYCGSESTLREIGSMADKL